jgi:hypothetical protein
MELVAKLRHRTGSHRDRVPAAEFFLCDRDRARSVIARPVLVAPKAENATTQPPAQPSSYSFEGIFWNHVRFVGRPGRDCRIVGFASLHRICDNCPLPIWVGRNGPRTGHYPNHEGFWKI